MALSTRLTARRERSVWLPATFTSSRLRCTVTFAAPAPSARASRTSAVIWGNDTVVRSSITPRSARASTRKLSTRRSAWSSPSRTLADRTDASFETGGDFAAATSREVRIIASGVRSSCEALATKAR